MDSIQRVVDALERAPGVVVPLVREVPAAVVKRRPKPGKWSAHEHACHLAVVHRLFFDRLEIMLRNPAPVITPYDPGTHDPDDALLRLDLSESLDQFVRDRALLVNRLRSLSPADWNRTAEHGEYSHYSVFIMFRHLALHDFFHAYRIEELLLHRGWTADWRGNVALRREDLAARPVRELIGALNAELSAMYSEPGANHFGLEAAEVAPGRGAFLVAYREDQAVGCGAVRLIDATTAEFKRMYVDPAFRGTGIGRRLVEALEEEARRLGATRLVLETGTRQLAALALYERCGFTPIPLYGEYCLSPDTSICMGKSLGGSV